ncbi:hypothetical protein HJTV-2_gp55 [Haloarcula virus HJTV-2]|uniref:Uncharacterized protein n=1 Tax=Haloarcula virus HJTV-2 TaxID=2877986 RepID=A0AAE8XVT3_9CAUD|nr:hypothetical protein M1M33_gp092 [Haloarcula virus HJTV-2]UBF21535.1 hypothetical protein HRTV-24_gp49 [Halorubrum virus HRTV-24]UBF21675.1 hypothetical protein HJTV-2_gp55 [Haloarcula virus HJTV-2]
MSEDDPLGIDQKLSLCAKSGCDTPIGREHEFCPQHRE